MLYRNKNGSLGFEKLGISPTNQNLKYKNNRILLGTAVYYRIVMRMSTFFFLFLFSKLFFSDLRWRHFLFLLWNAAFSEINDAVKQKHQSSISYLICMHLICSLLQLYILLPETTHLNLIFFFFLMLLFFGCKVSMPQCLLFFT